MLTVMGVIISRNYVLTAADCVDKTEYTYVIRAGSSDCTWWGSIYNIKKKFIHDLFVRKPSLKYDIAVLETATEIQFTDAVRSIIMAEKDFDPSDVFVEISGYGRICADNQCPNSDKLMKVEMEVITRDECLNYFPKILSNELCHIDSSHHSAMCQGDSGGPVTLARSTEELLVGVLSYVYKCMQNDTSVSSSIPEFRDWIKNYTKI
ncbi:clotting factor B-like [Bradysia coprophila]|uniref:clotting factor B-like n=1 Tax=Bradysia coprophila TaxID=38358 RepID=UPI00187D774D|nr:clotting factor B-like [Bradysia coprophila]